MAVGLAMTRPTILLPPKGWRPPALTCSVIFDVAVARQRARCGCDKCMQLDEVERPFLRSKALTRLDHRPPVHEREFLPHLNDTTPSANDPKYIRAVDVDHDQPVTIGDGKRMRKVNRIRADEADHAGYMAEKVPGQHRGRQSKGFR